MFADESDLCNINYVVLQETEMSSTLSNNMEIGLASVEKASIAPEIAVLPHS
jgi:hypothetical protein